MAGGGFGFGLLADVQMLGFYQAQHSDGRKPFLAYVLQVATSSSHFLVYRRYSQIAGLAAKLHFHPPVGLPPKYALQVFPLTEAQLQQRFDGLQAFLSEVFAHLTRQHAAGLQHDASSPAGLDMQIFCDFVSHHRNRPPKPVKNELPDWAKPSAAAPTVWADVESVTDSEDVGLLESDGDSEQGMELEEDGTAEEETSDVSTQFRNEVLQAEGNLSALWHCVRAYMQATTAWWGATGAVLDEYKRVADMSLFKEAQLGGEGNGEQRKTKKEENIKTHASRLVKALAQVLETVQPEFEKKCEDAVLSPLEVLNHEILPDIKHSYWTRHNSVTGLRNDGAPTDLNVRRLQQERETLHIKLRADVKNSMTALVALQNEMLATIHDQLQGFEHVQRLPRQRSQSQPVLAHKNDRRRRRDQRDDMNTASGIVQTPSSLTNGCHEEGVSALSTLTKTQDPQSATVENINDINVINTTGVEDTGAYQSSAGENGNESDDEAERSAEEGTAENEDEPEREEQEFLTQHDEETKSQMWVWGRPPSLEGGTPLVLRPKQVSLVNSQSIVQVACGGEHLLYLTSTGDVYSYGDNEDKKVASVIVAASTGTTECDTSRANTHTSFLAPRLVEELALEKALHRATITMVACGAQHSLAITDAGELYTWGSGEDGRLGHGDMRDRAVPRKVMSLLRENIINASCGGAHTAVLTAKSTVFTFGRGRNGRLGLGDNKWRDTPHQIVALPQGTRITHVVCGWNFTAALDREGSVFTWGKQSEGQCGLGYVDKDQVVPRRVEKLQEIAGGSPVVDVACGYTHTVVLTASGELYSWGLGEYGQLAAYKKDRAAKEKNGAVDGGREHTLALIDTDLPRTFPSLKLFDSSGPYYAFLLEVLETYACYRPDLGYIQGMSYLAAMLCLHMPQDRYLAFQCLANLMVNEHLFTFYLLDADLAGVYYSLFDTFLHTRHPQLHAHLKEIGVFSCSMYLMNWLQTLFLQVLPLELAARVFDNFLLDGTVFLFRTAMAVHELLAPELMTAEMDVALPLMQRNVIYQDTWNALVSEQSLFDTVETIAVPSHIYTALDRVVNDVFFYEKRGDPDASGGKKMLAYASGGQSVGIGHVKHERRRMYTISDALNGVLGGF
ncbi:hypothetical protein PHYBOEH_007222 [Phytophthora boehmeriae]|uniref:Rab-GAP TBC domain-containing protein n=1 Tax=Phytophthora boehmeriae TaxID=109152 RepID=A0A8T1W8H9_9STRA|nr:hypothetical protein PHYBOEH_007222 [Phytophthora boehmeriae]